MTYTINHICGHESVMQMQGNNANGEHERKVTYYESLVCPECHIKAQVFDNAMEDAELAEIVSNLTAEEIAKVPNAAEEQKAQFTAEIDRAFIEIKKVWHKLEGYGIEGKAKQLSNNLKRYIPDTDYLNPHGKKDRNLDSFCGLILHRLKKY